MPISTAAILAVWAAVVLALLWWSRPRPPERPSLARSTPGLEASLWLPVSQRWQRNLAAADYPSLSEIRRRRQTAIAGIGAASMALAGALAWLARAPDAPPPSASRPVPTRTEPVRPPSPTPAKPAPPTPAPAAAPAVPVEPEAVPLAELRTTARLFSSAKVKPLYEAYSVKGVAILNVTPGSFWDLVGVESGDVVIELFGDPIDEPADTVALIRALESADRLRMRVRTPDGDVRYIEYDVPE